MQTYETSKKLNSGGWKSCWTVKGRRGIVALVCNRPKETALVELARELEELTRLAVLGFPVLETFGIHIVKCEGEVKYAIIAKRYVAQSKEYASKFRELYTEQSVKDFDLMDRLLKEKNLQIHDLQFLIDKKGHVVIADPLGIKDGYYEYDGRGQVHDFRRKAVEVSSRKASLKPVPPGPL